MPVFHPAQNLFDVLPGKTGDKRQGFIAEIIIQSNKFFRFPLRNAHFCQCRHFGQIACGFRGKRVGKIKLVISELQSLIGIIRVFQRDADQIGRFGLAVFHFGE